jgi:hypothetical protein
MNIYWKVYWVSVLKVIIWQDLKYKRENEKDCEKRCKLARGDEIKSEWVMKLRVLIDIKKGNIQFRKR